MGSPRPSVGKAAQNSFEMLTEVVLAFLFVARSALAVSEPDPEPLAHFLANGTWAHPDIAPSYFSGRSPTAPVPVVAPGLSSTYVPQQQYLTQHQQQYLVDNLLNSQPQILDRRLTGATLSYENGMYGTRVTLPHSDHVATAGGIYTSTGVPISQGGIFPATQSHTGTLIQGHYNPQVIAARVPQVMRSPIQTLVNQNYQLPGQAIAGRAVNQVPLYTTANHVDHRPLASGSGYLSQPICTN